MSEHDDELFGIERRKAIVTAVLAIVLLAAAIFLIGELANFGKMTKALRRADGRWFLVCLAGELAAYVGYIAAYRDVARADGGPKLPLWTVTRVVVVGFGAYVAGSSAGTLGVDYWALQKAGDEPHRALRRVLALNTLQWAVLALAAMLAAIGALAGAAQAPLSMELAWLVVLPACVAGALWFTAPRRVERFAARPVERGGRVARVLRSAFADAIGGVVMVRHLVARPGRYPFALAGFPLFWAGDIVGMWAALRAFDVRVGVLPLVLAYTTAYAVTSLPLPAGGAGGVEAGLAFSLEAVGVPLASALLATLVYRFFTLWLPIALALVAIPQVKRLAGELPHVEHEPAPG
jgi:uncharacterized membrane protein YbhN (UPF0104 family)